MQGEFQLSSLHQQLELDQRERKCLEQQLTDELTQLRQKIKEVKLS